MAEEFRDLNDDYPGAGTFRFGDDPEECGRLTDLVLSGAKTAICAALRDFPAGEPGRPQVGRRDIATDWNGMPLLVIETVEVTETRFRDISEDFARAEGEGGLPEWRDRLIPRLEREGGWSEDMMLLCERFCVVEVIE